MTIEFAKWHALRNDFILLEERPGRPVDEAGLARMICDRHAGAGADGLVLFARREAGRAVVRIINADGSEAAISGNGYRCAAGALYRMGHGREGRIELESLSGLSAHELVGDRRGVLEIRSAYAPPRFEPGAIPVRREGEDALRLPLRVAGETIHASCVSVGNPHAVFFDGWDEESWPAIGAAVERLEIFPERTNVEFVRVTARDRLQVRVWERGVGRTASSGTGAAASFSVARRLGLVDDEVRVQLEGGELLVRETENGLAITGTCAEVYRGVMGDPPAEEEA